jgi:uncharacterized protein with von Willebrand factor type A (vWA) domain
MAGNLFLDFFYNLRAYHVRVTTHDWLAFFEALAKGLHDESLDGFYQVSRCILVSTESEYDLFDQAFAVTFRGVEHDLEMLLKNIDEWLQNPRELMYLDPQLRAAIEALGIEELKRQLMERLEQQKKRHEGGNRWVGTGGTSPFGQGGQHPSGVRMGGSGGGRSALAVADSRRFRQYRRDLVLDTRQVAAALRRLRKLSRKGAEDELDLDATIDETARNCGDLEIVMRPPRHNDVRMLLLLDVGGSMDPHAHLVSRLFSAAHQSGGFKQLEHFYFHNCVYSRVYKDAQFRESIPIDDLFRTHDENWYLVLVGDAWMHPGELSMTSGDFWNYRSGPSGLTCLARLADHYPKSAWLNPEPPRVWQSPTIAEIARVFAMFPLTLEGLDDMVKHFRRPPEAVRRALVHRLVREAS